MGQTRELLFGIITPWSDDGHRTMHFIPIGVSYPTVDVIQVYPLKEAMKRGFTIVVEGFCFTTLQAVLPDTKLALTLIPVFLGSQLAGTMTKNKVLYFVKTSVPAPVRVALLSHPICPPFPIAALDTSSPLEE